MICRRTVRWQKTQDWKRHICIIVAKIHDTFANLPVKNPPIFRKCLERSYNTTFGQQRGIMRCWKNNTKMYDMIFSPFFYSKSAIWCQLFAICDILTWQYMKTSILKYMSDSIYYNVKLAKLTPNALKPQKV